MDDVTTTIEHNANSEVIDIEPSEPTFVDAETGEVLNADAMFK